MSTIQIKRGTGSAVPSGLADGELAINLDSRQLYFGSSSVSVSDFKINNLTVNELTSSIVTSSIIFSSGSNIFGDASTDSHTFNGDITASGNISASGDVTARLNNNTGFMLGSTNALSGDANNILYLGNNNTWEKIVYGRQDSDQHSFVGNITSSNNISGSLTGTVSAGSGSYHILQGDTSKNTALFIDGSVTASGNISSSGTVTANKYVSDDTGYFIGAQVPPVLSLASSRLRISSSNDIFYDSADDHIFTSEGTEVVHIRGDEAIFEVTGDIDLNGNLDTSGHITASGNISASGNSHTFGGNISIDQDLLHTGDSNTKISFSDADQIDLQTGGGIRLRLNDTINTLNQDTKVDGDLEVTSHITASGNISSSAGSILSVPQRHLDQTVQTANGSKAQGDIYYAPGSGAGVSTTAGLVYGLATNGNLFAVDKDTESTCTGLVAVAIGSNSLTDGMLLRGMVKLSHDPFPGGEAAVGKAVYIGDSGQLTGSIAGFASDDFIRIVGYEMESGGVIYFNPDNTFIKKA